jgi:protein-tyrosine phosphatase
MKPDLFGIPGPWNGKLSIAKRPRGGDWLEDEARGWVLAGLDSIISLLELDEAADLDLSGEASHAKTLGLQFTSFPIPDRNIPSSTPEAVRLLQAILKELEVGRSVAVHCRQGLGRSGMIAAGVLIQAGMDPDSAIDLVSKARGQSVPETAEQRRWLQRLPSKHLVSIR